MISDKVLEKILQQPLPVDVKQVQWGLLCTGTFYPHLAQVTWPICNLIKSGTVWDWTTGLKRLLSRLRFLWGRLSNRVQVA
jgi:hypothetical protein